MIYTPIITRNPNPTVHVKFKILNTKKQPWVCFG